MVIEGCDCQQVENEFGWMQPCDHNYTTHLKGVFRQNLGENVVLFTTDPSSNLQCGAIDGVFATIDFGPGLFNNVSRVYVTMAVLLGSQCHNISKFKCVRKHFFQVAM